MHKGDPAAEVYKVVDEVAQGGGGRGGQGVAMGPGGDMCIGEEDLGDDHCMQGAGSSRGMAASAAAANVSDPRV
jgi:hypothetical protein